MADFAAAVAENGPISAQGRAKPAIAENHQYREILLENAVTLKVSSIRYTYKEAPQ
jgi:hypothetical protein